MLCIAAVRQRTLVVQGKVSQWVALGFLIFLCSAFFLGGGQQKTIFYILVALPSLFLLGRIKDFLKADSLALFSVFFFMGYFSVNAFFLSGVDSMQAALKFSLYVLCLMVAIDSVVSRFSVSTVPALIAAAAAVAAIACFAAVLIGDLPVRHLLAERFSLKEMAGWGTDNPITSAVVFGLAVLSAWWLFPRRPWYIQMMLILLMFASLLLIFISKSRGPLVALACSVFLLVVFRRSRADFLLAAGLALTVLASLFLLNLDDVAASRAVEPNYRLGIWVQALERIREHWLFGQGFESDALIMLSNGHTVVTHSHSFVLEVFRQGGGVGGGVFLLMLVLLLRRALSAQVGFFLLWFIYGALCLSTNGRMVLSRPSVEWFSFWLPLFFVYFYTMKGHWQVVHPSAAGDVDARQSV